jgi:hypothetical protein
MVAPCNHRNHRNHNQRRTMTIATTIATKMTACRLDPVHSRMSGRSHLSMGNDDDNVGRSNDDDENEEHENENDAAPPPSYPNFLRRFTDPIIDDPALPLTDALMSQIVAPTLQVYWLVVNGSPRPTWLASTAVVGRYSNTDAHFLAGSMLTPVLIHGAGLAVCWIMGALAANMYEGRSYAPSSASSMSSSTSFLERYSSVLGGIIRAGSFAIGILVLSTQMDLLFEFRGRYVTLGESDESDFRLLVAYVEVINDVFWEGLVISSWRIAHAHFMSVDDDQRGRF